MLPRRALSLRVALLRHRRADAQARKTRTFRLPEETSNRRNQASQVLVFVIFLPAASLSFSLSPHRTTHDTALSLVSFVPPQLLAFAPPFLRLRVVSSSFVRPFLLSLSRTMCTPCAHAPCVLFCLKWEQRPLCLHFPSALQIKHSENTLCQVKRKAKSSSNT